MWGEPHAGQGRRIGEAQAAFYLDEGLPDPTPWPSPRACSAQPALFGGTTGSPPGGGCRTSPEKGRGLGGARFVIPNFIRFVVSTLRAIALRCLTSHDILGNAPALWACSTRWNRMIHWAKHSLASTNGGSDSRVPRSAHPETPEETEPPEPLPGHSGGVGAKCQTLQSQGPISANARLLPKSDLCTGLRAKPKSDLCTKPILQSLNLLQPPYQTHP